MNPYDLQRYMFLSKNKPGNDGYGQTGSKGKKGQSGNSVFFTPCDLSVEESVNICLERIAAGQELSDNADYKSAAVTYRNNDYILDSRARIYILRMEDGETSLEFLRDLYESSSPVADATCRTYVDDSSTGLGFLQKNPAYLGEYSKVSSSPYIYHRDRYSDVIPGVWVEFTLQLTADADTQDYTYRYVLMLPDGRRVERYSGVPVCDMFVENRMLYGCDTSLGENAIGYRCIGDSSEYDEETAEKFRNEIMQNCTAYAEVMAVNGRIYRKYIDITE